MSENQAATQEESLAYQEENAAASSQRLRRRQALLIGACVVSVVISFGLGISLGVQLSKNDNNDDDTQPSSSDRLDSAAPTEPPSPVLPTTNIWKPLGQQVSGNTDFGKSVALNENGRIMATHQSNRMFMYEYGRITDEWQVLGQAISRNVGRVDLSRNGMIAATSDGSSSYYSNSYGSVQVYKYDPAGTGNWTNLGQRINGIGGSSYGRYVSSAALSSDGMIIAAGAYNTATGSSSGSGGAGMVRIFQYNGDMNEWQQLGQNLPGDAPNDRLGASVAVSGDGAIVAAGAPSSESTSNDFVRTAGFVRVFKYTKDTNEWVDLGQVLVGSKVGDYFGSVVALSTDGTTLAVGAPATTNRNGDETGYVRTFKYNGRSERWEQIGQDLETEAASPESGWSMAMSRDGEVVATGGTRTNRGAGIVRIYQYDGESTMWEQIGQNLNGKAADDQFGYSLALSANGSIVVAGAAPSAQEGYIQAFSSEP